MSMQVTGCRSYAGRDDYDDGDATFSAWEEGHARGNPRREKEKHLLPWLAGGFEWNEVA